MKLKKIFLLAVSLFFLLGLGSTGLAQVETVVEPRAENFVFYVDNSGSMGHQYEDLGLKSEVARDVLLAINEDLPELEANFGVYTYGPYWQYRPVTGYHRQDMANAINSIPLYFDLFGRRTPMGSDLQRLDNDTISGLQDRVAVIVVTDGESNVGPHPREVMQNMYNTYGDRICFHFISLAQRPPAGTTVSDEEAFVDELAGLNPCTVKADANELHRDFVRADFIQEVFYSTREVVTEPAPQPEPIIVPPEPEPVEEVIVFSNITFDFDSAEIRPEYEDILREAADIIMDRPDTTVLVEGHTCNIGPADYNQGLSERRAQSVADFLEEEGVSEDRLETVGHGLTQPRFDNDTIEGRSLNRRVEMSLQ